MRALPIYRDPSSPPPLASPVRPDPAHRVPPRSVRLSLTDRCDLACVYCRPHKRDGYVDEPLDFDAWKTMVRGLVRAGVRRVRLTGGEPLLFGRVVDAISFLASLGLDDLALTTNATRLAKLARPLANAGLLRVNISLDTLDDARFWRMTRGGHLATVLAGVDAACAAGFRKVSLNTVVMRDENDDELAALVHYAWDRGIEPRFLEVMKVGEGAKLADRVVTAAEMRVRLAPLLDDGAAGAPDADRGPARYVRARTLGPNGEVRRVGFISGTSDTYCSGCDRLRVASDGVLRPCLATNDGVGAADEAQRGDELAVAAAVGRAWTMKPDGETWRGCTEATAADVSMRAIGG